MSEPMTLATDHALGALCGLWAVLLLSRNVRLRQSSVRLWALALIAVATASFAGGTYHGFQHAFSMPVAAILWKLTTISMGVASFLLLAGAFSAAFSGRTRRWSIAAAGLKLGISAGWMARHDEFRFVIYDYGSTLALIMLLVLAQRTHGAPGHRAYIAAGIVTSAAAAAVQLSGIRLHQHFNHNDLMHVIQVGGMWLLYKGGARLRDAGGTDGRHA